jgi:hypothetical protein
MALAVVLALGLLAVACSSNSDGAGGTTTTAGATASDTSWLFVQTASGGTWSPGADGTSGTLTLTGVDPEVQAFTDRPQRQVAWEDPEQFVADWSSRGFAAVPPNASLTLHAAKPGELPVVLELSTPTWNASSSTLTYAASVVDRGAEKTTVPATFEGATLYVDSGSTGQNLGLVQIWATLAQDSDSVQIVLDTGMSLGTTFQFGTVASNCNTFDNGTTTTSCTAAWQVHNRTLMLNGSRAVYNGTVQGPFVTTQGVTFGTVLVPGTNLTGTATLTSGATLQMVGPDNTPINIPSGPFAVPVSLG